jgi:diguanylate cyclase (GGDEF)-like protein/PAS domain S-box-containing protein
LARERSKHPRAASAQIRRQTPLPTDEDLYRDLVQHSQDLLCTHDLSGRLLSFNPLPARLLGYEVEELLQQPMRNFLAPEYREQFDEYLAQIRRDGFSEGSMMLLTRSGERRIWEYHNTLRTDYGPEPIVRGMAHDVTERIRAEAALRRSEERFRVALANSPVIVSSQDRDLRYTWIGGAVFASREPQQYLGRSDTEIFAGEDGARLSAIKQSVLERGDPARTEIGITLGGKKRYFDLTVEPQRDRRGAVAGITCAAVEITALKRAAEEREELIAKLQQALQKNEYLATHDALTGAPNRRLLADRLDQALARAQRQRTKVAVMALDLDGFKVVNDTFGHRGGDLLLASVVARLRARLRASDTLSRTGGDEFTVLADVADSQGAKILTWALQTAFAQPFELDGKDASIGASIGVAIYPEHGRTADEILAAADKAMYAAKGANKGRHPTAKSGLYALRRPWQS